MATKKQELARARNYFKFRLLGGYANSDARILTPEELNLVVEYNTIRNKLIAEFDKNSKVLGLKIPEHRCFFGNCRNKAKFKSSEEFYGKEAWFCKKHYDEYLEIYSK